MNQKDMKAVPAYRKLEILKLLRQSGMVQIAELAKHCGVSQATVRRDLNELDKNGAICRTHGGAVMVQGTAYEQPHKQKLALMQEQKQRIAIAATNFISDGDSVFIDSGTTALLLSQRLGEYKNLTVITNNTDIVNSINLHPTSTFVLTGGVRREEFSVLVGSITEDFMRDIKVDKAFVGADAIDSKNGLYNSSFTESALKRLIVLSGRVRILISDSSKFQIPGLVRICGLESFDFIITDDGLDAQKRKDIEDVGVGLIIA